MGKHWKTFLQTWAQAFVGKDWNTLNLYYTATDVYHIVIISDNDYFPQFQTRPSVRGLGGGFHFESQDLHSCVAKRSCLDNGRFPPFFLDVLLKLAWTGWPEAHHRHNQQQQHAHTNTNTHTHKHKHTTRQSCTMTHTNQNAHVSLKNLVFLVLSTPSCCVNDWRGRGGGSTGRTHTRTLTHTHTHIWGVSPTSSSRSFLKHRHAARFLKPSPSYVLVWFGLSFILGPLHPAASSDWNRRQQERKRREEDARKE